MLLVVAVVFVWVQSPNLNHLSFLRQACGGFGILGDARRCVGVRLAIIAIEVKIIVLAVPLLLRFGEEVLQHIVRGLLHDDSGGCGRVHRPALDSFSEWHEYAIGGFLAKDAEIRCYGDVRIFVVERALRIDGVGADGLHGLEQWVQTLNEIAAVRAKLASNT